MLRTIESEIERREPLLRDTSKTLRDGYADSQREKRLALPGAFGLLPYDYESSESKIAEVRPL